jgi:hypothetical protein
LEEDPWLGSGEQEGGVSAWAAGNWGQLVGSYSRRALLLFGWGSGSGGAGAPAPAPGSQQPQEQQGPPAGGAVVGGTMASVLQTQPAQGNETDLTADEARK